MARGSVGSVAAWRWCGALVWTAVLAAACSGGGDRAGGAPAPDPGATECNNTCTSYPTYWMASCPAGQRCIQFQNACATELALSYQIGCDGNGEPGAPTCNCTQGPTLAPGASVYWQIVDVDDASSCSPKVSPQCLTSGLAVMVNPSSAGLTCAVGTRVEFTAGNSADPYGKFDSYDIDAEKDWYGTPVLFEPAISCANDAGLDCRPLWCNSPTCPDAFLTPTSGGCGDGRSPAAACQTTFGDFGTASGFLVQYCPSGCSATGGSCPSCQESTPCS